MLTIDRMRLSLPAAFRGREQKIARLVAEELATLPLAADLCVERLMVPQVKVSPHATERDVARAIAASVGAGLTKEMR